MKQLVKYFAFWIYILFFSITCHGAIAPYCNPNPNTDADPGTESGWDIGIANVTLNTINNNSTYNAGAGCTGAVDSPVRDYTAQSTNLEQGVQYGLSVTVGPYDIDCSGYSDPNGFEAWIDYNQDGDFDDISEYLGVVTGIAPDGTGVLNFTVPGTALLGPTRLRVYSDDADYGILGTPNTPCFNQWGEMEDYTVNITACTGANMVYVSSAATQTNTFDVMVGNTNQEIIGIEVVTNNPCAPINMTSFTFQSTGTTNLADIENAKLWYNGTNNNFNTAVQVGIVVEPIPVLFSVNGFIQPLEEGTNYFWLTYDIKAGATPGNFVDAVCLGHTLGGCAPSNPAGNRKIIPVTSTMFPGIRAQNQLWAWSDAYIPIVGYTDKGNYLFMNTYCNTGFHYYYMIDTLFNIVETHNVRSGNSMHGWSCNAVKGGITTDGQCGYVTSAQSNAYMGGDKFTMPFGVAPPTLTYHYDYWVVRNDSDDTRIFSVQLGGDYDDFPVGVVKHPGTGYLVGGNSYSHISGNKTIGNLGGPGDADLQADFYFYRLDTLGNILWQRALGGDGEDYMSCMIATSTGRFVFAGKTNTSANQDVTQATYGGNDAWIVKTDTALNILWQRRYGGGSADGAKMLIVETDDKHYVAAGASNSMSNPAGGKSESGRGAQDYWIIKLDSANGNVIWNRTLGGDKQDQVRDLQATCDGGVVIAGVSKSGAVGDKTEPSWDTDATLRRDWWIVKLDINGNVEWEKTLGTVNNNGIDDDNVSLIQDCDGEYIISGRAHEDPTGNKTITGTSTWAQWIVTVRNDNPCNNPSWCESIVPEGDCYEAPPTVMPIKLLSFEAKLVPDGTIVSWATESESNNSHFILYRSNDYKDWKEIEIVDGQGTTSEVTTYKVLDKGVMPGINYYKLKQVDYDGKSEVFGPVLVNNPIGRSETIKIFDFIGREYDNIESLQSGTYIIYDGIQYQKVYIR